MSQRPNNGGPGCLETPGMAAVVAISMTLLGVRGQKGMPGAGSPLSKGVGMVRGCSRFELGWRL